MERVPDEEIDPVGANPVPEPESMRDRGTDQPLDRARPARRKIIGGQIPEIADGSVAIADVKRIGPRDDALRRAMADRDDQVVAAQIEGLDRFREGCDVPTVAAPPQRHLRDPGFMNGMRFDGGREAPFPVHERVDRGMREHLAETSRHFSPPRIPVSQSWTRATRRESSERGGGAGAGALTTWALEIRPRAAARRRAGARRFAHAPGGA